MSVVSLMLFLSKLTELGVTERLQMKTKHARNLANVQLNPLDFERLTESQMEFKGQNWEVQEFRFDQEMNFNHEYIFWTESYAALVLATHFLDQVGHTYSIAYDSAVEMYCFTTDYASSWTN
jgi:hypothetical protein